MLLKTLARNEGKIITVDALCEALWGDNPFGYENSLNAHAAYTRKDRNGPVKSQVIDHN